MQHSLMLIIRDGTHYKVIRYTDGDNTAEVVDTFTDDRFGSSVRYAHHVNTRPTAELSEREQGHRGCIPVMLP